MSEVKEFEAYKIHKLQDRLEQEAYEWMEYQVQEFYGVEDFSELNREQVDSIYQYSESEECYEPYVGMALRSMCDNWYYDNEEEDPVGC